MPSYTTLGGAVVAQAPPIRHSFATSSGSVNLAPGFCPATCPCRCCRRRAVARGSQFQLRQKSGYRSGVSPCGNVFDL